MKTWIALGIAALSLAGCSKKEGGGGGGGGRDMEKTPEAFAAWMPKDAAKLWDGAWATRMTSLMNVKKKKSHTSMAGDPVAVEVKGDKATVWDGESEHTLGFHVASPCEARFTEALTEGSMKGGFAYHDQMFVIRNGAIAVGSGSAGFRRGKAAVVCAEGMSSGVTILDDKGACTRWSKKFGDWESKPETCVWSQKDGKDLLTIGTGDWATFVYADGDALVSEQFVDAEKLTKRTKDFAEAKALVRETIDEKDPGVQAKKAGGVVGKTDTVVSLTASLAADKSLAGKAMELTAVVSQVGTFTSNGKTSHSVRVKDLDAKDTKFDMPCELGETAPAPEIKNDLKVVVKGTLKESFGTPALEPCTIAVAP